MLVELISDHELEQVVHFPTRGQNTLPLIITSLPGQFVDIHSPNRLSDHDIVSGTLKIVIPTVKKPKRKVYKYQKGDYESMKADALKFAKEKYFNGYSGTIRFKKTLICSHLLSRIQWINISHQRLVAQFHQSHG